MSCHENKQAHGMILHSIKDKKKKIKGVQHKVINKQSLLINCQT